MSSRNPRTKRGRTGDASSSAAPTHGGRRATRTDPPVPTNPFGISFRDDDHEAQYHRLAQRHIINTRFSDNPTLDGLGLRTDVDWMFNQLGWGYFMNLATPTYIRLTLEFLSSYDAEITSGRHAEEGRITFRLFNNDHQLTLAEFNSIYDLPTNGLRIKPLGFRDRQFWQAITHELEYNPSSSKSSCIVNPCFRYIHRVLSSTLFGRGESEGVVRLDELYFLWSMVNSSLADTGSYLAKHFLKVSKKNRGKIVIGGLITPIAIHYGYNLAGLEQARGPTRIDFESCIAMGMIQRSGMGYVLRFKNTDYTHPLPDPSRTSVRDPDNWKMMYPQGDNPDAFRLPAPPASDTDAYQSEEPDIDAPSASQPPRQPPRQPSTPMDDTRSLLHAIRLEQMEQRALLDRQGEMMTQHYARIEERQQQFFMNLQQQQQQQYDQQQSYFAMMDRIQQWHISQGHFPPPQ